MPISDIKDLRLILNPVWGDATGTHKDRESRAIVEHAISRGYAAVGVASTGNSAISLAERARHYGLECHVWVTQEMSSDRRCLLDVFCPVVHELPGGYLSDMYEASGEAMSSMQVLNSNPEVCEIRWKSHIPLGHWLSCQRCDFIVCPVNHGTLLHGLAAGLRERESTAELCAAVAPGSLLATSIKDSAWNPQWRDEYIRDGGTIVAVSDENIMDSLRWLAELGAVVEPAAACAVAAALLANSNRNGLAVLTGTDTRFSSCLSDCVESKSRGMTGSPLPSAQVVWLPAPSLVGNDGVKLG